MRSLLLLLISMALLLISPGWSTQVVGAQEDMVIIRIYEPVDYDVYTYVDGDVYILFGRENIYSLTDEYMVPRVGGEDSPCSPEDIEGHILDSLPWTVKVSFNNGSGVLEISVVWGGLEKDLVGRVVSSLPRCVERVEVYATLGSMSTVEYLRDVLSPTQPGEDSVIERIDDMAVEIFSRYGKIDTFLGLHASIRIGLEMTLLIVIQGDIQPSMEDIKAFAAYVREAIPGDYPLVIAFNKSEIEPLPLSPYEEWISNKEMSPEASPESSGDTTAQRVTEEAVGTDTGVEGMDGLVNTPLTYLIIILLAIPVAYLVIRMGR